MKISDMNWLQVEQYLASDDRAVVPIGSTEQHAYLSLSVDSILSEKVAVDAALAADPGASGSGRREADPVGPASLIEIGADAVEEVRLHRRLDGVAIELGDAAPLVRYELNAGHVAHQNGRTVLDL